MATTEINKTKILVKVHEPLIAIMQHKIDAACLKRDAYLDKALRVEAEFLRKEIATPNSDKAKNYIAAQLGDLKLKPLNLLLSTETVDLINEVCKEKNVPRDAFMNRFFLFLIMTDTVLLSIFEELVAYSYGFNYELKEVEANFEDIFSRYFKEIPEVFDYVVSERAGKPNDGYFENNSLLLFNRSSIFDTIEDSIVNSFTRLRIVIYSFEQYHDGHRHQQEEKKYPEKCPPTEIYLYPFKKNALQRLPSEYEFLKLDNSLGFNTFMSDELVFEQEEKDLALKAMISEISKQDKLFAAVQKERKERMKKAQQAKLVKSAGEAK